MVYTIQPTKMVIWKMGYYYCFANISRDICWGCNGTYSQIISTLNDLACTCYISILHTNMWGISDIDIYLEKTWDIWDIMGYNRDIVELKWDIHATSYDFGVSSTLWLSLRFVNSLPWKMGMVIVLFSRQIIYLHG